MAELSEARKRANKKWNDANMKNRYDRIQLVVPKGNKEIIEAAAKEEGKSLNSYVVEAVDKQLVTSGKPSILPSKEGD